MLSRLLHTTNEKSYIIQDESTIERDYKVGDLIGQGSFASVWSATCLKTGKQFAMKSLLKHENQEWKKEVTMCRQVQDNPDTKTSKVMQIRDVYESREEAFIVSDLCLGGDLLDWMIDGPKKNVDEIRSLKMSENMLLAAESCHRAGLAHLDIKPENFCFRSEDSNSELVLVDFGSAEPFARAPYATTTGSYEKHLDDEVDLKRLVGMLAFSLALPFFVLLLCYNRFTHSLHLQGQQNIYHQSVGTVDFQVDQMFGQLASFYMHFCRISFPSLFKKKMSSLRIQQK